MTCTVTMSEAKSAEAKFGPTFVPLAEVEVIP
jgi:hypothetical protein